VEVGLCGGGSLQYGDQNSDGEDGRGGDLTLTADPHTPLAARDASTGG